MPVDAVPGYSSPYGVRFTTAAVDRLAGFDRSPWVDPHEQARVPFDEWYSPTTRTHWGAWGPPARQYPAPVGRPRGRLARERVVAVAAALVGLDYQHHHVPCWDPPPGWPQKVVRSGRRGPGVDCSNFVAFVYSYALGIDLPTGVVAQSQLHRSVTEGRLFAHRVQLVPHADHDQFVASLQPADILYLHSDAGGVSHAVLWLGDCGTGPGTAPLVIDSGGGGILDFHLSEIPAGVRIRPYRSVGWYARNTVYAHRIIPD